MVVIYRQTNVNVTRVYPIESFDCIESSIEVHKYSAEKTYTIVGLRNTFRTREVFDCSERMHHVLEPDVVKVVFGEYVNKKDRDDAFDRFLLALGEGCHAYESIYADGERLFRPIPSI